MSKVKIYTEEQVIDIFEKYGNMSAINARNILDLSESIELPSDEEIKEEASKKYQEQEQSYENSVEMFPINFANYLEVGFMDGMKYLRNKIQGGNNEN